MTTFQDGPAQGKHLMLKRAPRFLRVVEGAGQWDALDQLDDTPSLIETLYAYELVGEPGMCHINRAGGRGGFYPIATYRFVKTQPTDAAMRTTLLWIEWCHAAAFQRTTSNEP